MNEEHDVKLSVQGWLVQNRERRRCFCTEQWEAAELGAFMSGIIGLLSMNVDNKVEYLYVTMK